jgi:hypothetical protein
MFVLGNLRLEKGRYNSWGSGGMYSIFLSHCRNLHLYINLFPGILYKCWNGNTWTRFLFLDNCGEMEVVNHKTGDKCYMKFEPYSYFGGTPKKVTGTVNSVDDKVVFRRTGTSASMLCDSANCGDCFIKISLK